ncbi:hypothetical protein DPMN_085989 [Dreissena polymorpha]|uniref:HAT C-terminal dimerisation domain-containing protein n=1 Tax=Dreissena polymorpha TaxID=45954 RepID=A0A9D4BMG7_DREPO|nr:hypothetical protein DPMN_085989 [Dreissena polymorpha]
MVQSVTDKNKPAVYKCYAADHQCEPQQLDRKVNRLKVRWSLMDADKRPKTLLDALNACGGGYPLFQLILTELLSMPVTSASCERSFIVLKHTFALPLALIALQLLQCSTSTGRHSKSDQPFASTMSRNMHFL